MPLTRRERHRLAALATPYQVSSKSLLSVSLVLAAGALVRSGPNPAHPGSPRQRPQRVARGASAFCEHPSKRVISDLCRVSGTGPSAKMQISVRRWTISYRVLLMIKYSACQQRAYRSRSITKSSAISSASRAGSRRTARARHGRGSRSRGRWRAFRRASRTCAPAPASRQDRSLRTTSSRR